jgi:hypothetical protein
VHSDSDTLATVATIIALNSGNDASPSATGAHSVIGTRGVTPVSRKTTRCAPYGFSSSAIRSSATSALARATSRAAFVRRPRRVASTAPVARPIAARPTPASTPPCVFTHNTTSGGNDQAAARAR